MQSVKINRLPSCQSHEGLADILKVVGHIRCDEPIDRVISCNRQKRDLVEYLCRVARARAHEPGQLTPEGIPNQNRITGPGLFDLVIKGLGVIGLVFDQLLAPIGFSRPFGFVRLNEVNQPVLTSLANLTR